MSSKARHYHIVLLALFRIIYWTHGQGMREAFFERKVKGYRLKGFIISEEETSSLIECGIKCLTRKQLTCKSFNFQTVGNPDHNCQLSNATKPCVVEKVTSDEDYDYYEMIQNVPQNCPAPRYPQAISIPTVSPIVEQSTTYSGQRLVANDTKIRDDYAVTGIECILLCARDQCCRSANFKKDSSEKNCELFHPTDQGLTKNLIHDDTYDYIVVNQTNKTFSFGCTPCQYRHSDISNYSQCSCQSALFPSRSKSHYIKSQGTQPDMTSITACFWLKMSRSDLLSHYVSYATDIEDNEYIMKGVTYLKLGVQDAFSPGKNNIKHFTDGLWHTLCGSWASLDGSYTTYKDGMVENTGTGYSQGVVIRGHGMWVLGQDQDSYGGGFDSGQMVVGEMAEVNIWDRVLSRDEIRMLTSYCNPVLKGNVKSWEDFKAGLSSSMVLVDNPICCYNNTLP